MYETVFVAMSGGVDSSAAAVLLIEKGYHVCGITMEHWSGELPGSSAVDDARQVAKSLGIPHYVCDLQETFQKNVVNYFCSEYFAGRTPNPCVVCNRTIKFGALFDVARKLGADYLATGHYARVAYDEQRRRWVLKKGLDDHKDQSYVLYTLSQEILPHLIFPLGDYRKEEIRQIAADAGLSVAGSKESQEICFIPDNDYRSFLLKNAHRTAEPGIIYDREGNSVGEHQGVAFYTIGQRRGLGLALGYPAYVVEIDPLRNALVVGKAQDLLASGLTARDVNFIAIQSLQEPLQAQVKIRYNAAPVEAVISPGEGEEIVVRFSQPQKAVTPGQAVVFYQDDLVLGGGFIDRRI
ncbi:MAG TPA: tRNA 2-thiouridine(34) synthase MnmA [Peptococcaceae bacterium]|nr:tRNA 2-thiouridine(34) synthase MnmA [Peptococcaceae bacterium]